MNSSINQNSSIKEEIRSLLKVVSHQRKQKEEDSKTDKTALDGYLVSMREIACAQDCAYN